VKTFTASEPLTDAEFDRLGDFLKSCKGGRAMNVEALDGFFAALIAGTEIVMPSEYYREVFGGEMSEACEFGNLDEANEILGLMMRHWNTIAGTLNKDEVYGSIPLMVLPLTVSVRQLISIPMVACVMMLVFTVASAYISEEISSRVRTQEKPGNHREDHGVHCDLAKNREADGYVEGHPCKCEPACPVLA